jgi:uncharacterized protein YkwD
MPPARRLINRRVFVLSAAPCLFFGWRLTRLSQSHAVGVGVADNDLAGVKEQLHRVVNIERGAAGLSSLDLDEFACSVCERHSLEMVEDNFLSHWDRNGQKPYQYYSLAGGIDAVAENVSASEGLSPIRTDVITDLIAMHLRMYEEQPPNDGHRKSMLAPQHTHVGFGVARRDHSLRLTELYISRYVEVEAGSRNPNRHGVVNLRGRLLNPKHTLQQAEVFYEPMPERPSLEWLRTPRSYGLPEAHVTLRPVLPERVYYADGSSGVIETGRNGKFQIPVELPATERGIHTVVIWIKRLKAQAAIPVTNICIVTQ